MVRHVDDMEVLGVPWGLTPIIRREHGPRDDPSPVAPFDWTEHSVHHPISGPRSVFAADVDHSGERDILAAMTTDNDIIRWDDHHSRSFARHIIRSGLW